MNLTWHNILLQLKLNFDQLGSYIMFLFSTDIFRQNAIQKKYSTIILKSFEIPNLLIVLLWIKWVSLWIFTNFLVRLNLKNINKPFTENTFLVLIFLRIFLTMLSLPSYCPPRHMSIFIALLSLWLFSPTKMLYFP